MSNEDNILSQEIKTMSPTTKNRVRVTFMTDIEVASELETLFPGVNKSAQFTIALRRFLDDVKAKRITAEDIKVESKRVQDRRLGRE